MARSKLNLSIVVLLGLLLLGIIGINTIPLSVSKITLETTTSDGVNISYNLYQPQITEKAPVVIMGHGIMVNKEMMTSLALEIANQGYIVASLDWRGHGRSTGSLTREGLLLDLEAVMKAIPVHQPLADMEKIALLGYSMGGYPTYEFAVNHSAVKAWIGAGTTAEGSISTTTNPHNVLIIVAVHDEAFSPEQAKIAMAALTGLDIGDIEFERVYGSMAEGTARKIHVVPRADHLTTPWNSDVIMSATSWVAEAFGSTSQNTGAVFHQRILFLCSGMIGFIVSLCVLSYLFARKIGIMNEGTSRFSILERLSLGAFISRYYLFTLILVFSMAVYAPLFLTPLPFAAFLTALDGGLGINIMVYCWRLARRGDDSFTKILKETILQPPKMWVFSVIITAVFIVCYYSLVGLHFLGMVPSHPRIPYLVLYSVILFFSFWSYTFFIQKVSYPFLERKFSFRSPRMRFTLVTLLNFVLIHSWFSIIVLIPCIIINNYFFAMILILMVPIFLFMSFFSVYMENLTGSVIPSAVLHSVWMGFVVTTLTPYGSLLHFG